MSRQVVWITSYVVVRPSTTPATVLSSIPVSSTSPVPSMDHNHDHVQSAVLSAMSSAMPLVSTNTATSVPTTSVVSHTSSAPQQSEASGPHAHPGPVGSKNGNFYIATAMVILIILLCLLLLSIIVYGFYLRLCKHKCSPECEDTKAELAKYRSGQLRPITSEMVRAREAFNAATSAARSGSDADLERGTTLGASAPKSSFWTRTKGKFTGKSKHDHLDRPATARFDGANTIGDRFFTIGGDPYNQSRQYLQDPAPPLPTYHTPNTIRRDPFYGGASEAGPSRPMSVPSIYSQATDRMSRVSGFYTRKFRNDSYGDVAYLGAQWAPCDSTYPRSMSTASSSLKINDFRHVDVIAGATAPDHVVQKAVNDVNAIEAQKRERIRFGGYGGMELPEEIELAHLGSPKPPFTGRSKRQSASADSVDSYVPPDWRKRAG